MGFTDVIRRLSPVVFLALSGTTAGAHELWLEPFPAPFGPGDTVNIRILVGSDFIGEELGNFPHMQAVVDLFAGGERYGIPARMGDMPAFRFRAGPEGLLVVRYQSVANPVTHDDQDAFFQFLEEVRQPQVIREHQERDLPDRDIRETFTRYAKALIGIGDASGRDVLIGMQMELVAEDDPHANPSVGYRLYSSGNPVPNFPVYTLVRNADGTVTRQDDETDSEGRFRVTTTTGGTYMVNAVRVLPADPDGAVHWQSHWASSTFLR